ncbi:MAG: outer membrane protein transport protein [Polyangiaceae bacterium]|nr:outer membrane protein transport protein [Polyangiaceae bacterium]
MNARQLLALGLGVSVLCGTARAEAAGLYFSDRGVRPMGRAGAFIAGADDAGAIWYNPAGLADTPTSFLADFTWLRLTSEYKRQLLIRDASDTLQRVDSATVEGSTPVLPLPTLIGNYHLKEPNLSIAAGFYAPYVALAGYPETVNGQPSPARYTLGSFNASTVVLMGGWVGWAPTEWLRIGGGVQALMGTVRSTIAFSVSLEDRLLGAPEQPEYDALSQFEIGPFIAPSGNAGLILIPHESVRVGLSAHTPTVIDSDAKIRVRLPSSVIFDEASVDGEDAHVKVKLAGIVRAGIEVRPVEPLRIEAAFVREVWSAHDKIEATPKNMAIINLPGGPQRITLPSIDIPRNFQDSDSYRLGAEYQLPIDDYKLVTRAGVAYETSAVPDPYLSLSSLDFDKVLVTVGGSLYVGDHWRFDALYAHAFTRQVYVDPATAKVGRINPVKGNAPFEPVNGGTYSASADLIGFGLQYSFDAPEKPSKAEQPRLRRKPESDPKAAPLTPTNEEKADDVEELDDESFRGVKPADVDLDESNGKPKGKQPSGKQPETKKPSSKKPLDPKYRGVKPEDVDLD